MKSIIIKLIVSLIIVVFVPLPTLNLFDKECGVQPTGISDEEFLLFNHCSRNVKRTAQFGLEAINDYVTRNDPRPENVNLYASWGSMAIASTIYLAIIFIILSIVEFIWKKLRKASTTNKVSI